MKIAPVAVIPPTVELQLGSSPDTGPVPLTLHISHLARSYSYHLMDPAGQQILDVSSKEPLQICTLTLKVKLKNGDDGSLKYRCLDGIDHSK